ncbi:MAG: ATP-binding protein [Paracoccaceae bacterium]
MRQISQAVGGRPNLWKFDEQLLYCRHTYWFDWIFIVFVKAKTALEPVDATPVKNMFLSIITDYDLVSGVCELVDNAIDHWTVKGRIEGFRIDVELNSDRQMIKISDNAGGVFQDDIKLLVAPGMTREPSIHELIGVFGVGGKRAAIALGEHVEIRTRCESDKTIQIEITEDWLNDESWDFIPYEIPPIRPNTTEVEISKIRQGFSSDDVSSFFEILGATYGEFINAGCEIFLNNVPVAPVGFEAWAYPPDFSPRETKFEISPTTSGTVQVVVRAGLIRDRDPISENYGVYFYCNGRLIVRDLKTREVGYVSGEAGVPHPDASLSRVVVKLNGAPELMPWNSSKNAINYSHPAFLALRARIIDFCSYYSTLSRRFKDKRESEVYPFETGKFEIIDPAEATSLKKRVMPRPPKARSKTRFEIINDVNSDLMRKKPWTIGLVEAFGAIDVVSKQRLATKNRVALILLDSNLEIGLKEFIVERKDLYKPFEYSDRKLAGIFANRTEVIKEVKPYLLIDDDDIKKINFYYVLRNKLIHERATVSIPDEQVDDYRQVVERVLSKAFDLKFPES